MALLSILTRPLIDLTENIGPRSRVYLSLSPMPTGLWEDVLDNIPHPLNELFAVSEAQERLFTIYKFILANSAFLPVGTIKGNSVCPEPDPHKIWVCNIRGFRMALSASKD